MPYQTLSVARAEEAFELLDDHPEVSILLTDVVMPGMAGTELAVKATAEHPDLRVLLVSGYAREIVEQAPLANGPFKLLPKPFTIKELAQALRDTLNETT